MFTIELGFRNFSFGIFSGKEEESFGTCLKRELKIHIEFDYSRDDVGLGFFGSDIVSTINYQHNERVYELSNVTSMARFTQ